MYTVHVCPYSPHKTWKTPITPASPAILLQELSFNACTFLYISLVSTLKLLRIGIVSHWLLRISTLLYYRVMDSTMNAYKQQQRRICLKFYICGWELRELKRSLGTYKYCTDVRKKLEFFGPSTWRRLDKSSVYW